MDKQTQMFLAIVVIALLAYFLYNRSEHAGMSDTMPTISEKKPILFSSGGYCNAHNQCESNMCTYGKCT